MITLYTGRNQGQGNLHYYPITAKIETLEDFYEATRYDHTPGEFGGKNRKYENFLGADCIIGDIDNSGSENPEEWITLEMAEDVLSDYEYFAGPSRNHMNPDGKTKANGEWESPRPKYHFIFPIEHHRDPAKQKRYLKTLQEKFSELKWDPSLSDPARCLFGHTGRLPISEFRYHPGKPITTAFAGRPKGDGPGTGTPHAIPIGDMTPEELSKNPEAVQEGDRYPAHRTLAMYWANQGHDADEVERRLIEFNSKMPVPRAMHTEAVRVQTRNLADSAVQKVASTGGPNPDAEFKRIRNYRITKGPQGPIRTPAQVTTPEMLDALKHFVSMKYKSSDPVLTLRDFPDVLISKPSTLSTTLERIGYIWDVRSIPGALNKDDILERFRLNAEQISRMTCVPEDRMEQGTLFIPKLEFPDPKETGELRKFLDIFTFKTLKDRYRFACGILSLYLPGTYDGKIPMFALLAESQNAGKSTAVNEAVKLLTGMTPTRQSGKKEQYSSDVAQFSGVEGLSSRAVLYDNLLKLKPEEETVISVAISEPDRPAWIMHTSHADIRNSFVYFATFNDSEGFGRDLQERIIAIRMSDPDTVTMEQRERIVDQLQRAYQKQDEIISDLRYLTGLWTPDDDLKPLSGITTMQKFPLWTKRILPGLRALFPEVEHFDLSASDEDHRIDPRVEIFEEFVEWLFENTNFVKFRPGGKDRYIRLKTREVFEQFNVFSPDSSRGYTLNSFSAMFRESMRNFSGGSVNKVMVNGTRLYDIVISDERYRRLIDTKKQAEEEVREGIPVEY